MPFFRPSHDGCCSTMKSQSAKSTQTQVPGLASPASVETLIFFCSFSSIKGRPLPGLGSFSRYIFKTDHVSGLASPASVEALIFFCFFSSIKGRPLPGLGSFSRYIFKTDHVSGLASPASVEALIFFCFFSSIKGRKEECKRKKRS